MAKIMDKKRITEGTEKNKKVQRKTKSRQFSVPSKSSVNSVIKKRSASQGTKSKPNSLTVKVFDIGGKSVGTLTLVKEIFGLKPNLKLLAQANRVYQANLIPHTAHTKTRGEVAGGGAKPWRQKGTGKARAGSIRSPLWKGGGTTFGPRYRDTRLDLPKKQKRLALIHALSTKAGDGQIKVITKLESIKPKTKIVVNLLNKLGVNERALIVISQKNQNVILATRNIPIVTCDLAANLNALKVLKNSTLLFSKEAISFLAGRQASK